MRSLFIFLLVLTSCSGKAVSNEKKTAVIPDEIDPIACCSFANDFVNTNIQYTYLPETLTHDYSNNWDFDGDGKKDPLRLVGTDGAHVSFCLSLMLSSEKEVRYFSWIANDFPLLEDFKTFPENTLGTISHQFIVHDFNKDGRLDIFVNSAFYNRGITDTLKIEVLPKGNLILTDQRHLLKYLPN